MRRHTVSRTGPARLHVRQRWLTAMVDDPLPPCACGEGPVYRGATTLYTGHRATTSSQSPSTICERRQRPTYAFAAPVKGAARPCSSPSGGARQGPLVTHCSQQRHRAESLGLRGVSTSPGDRTFVLGVRGPALRNCVTYLPCSVRSQVIIIIIIAFIQQRRGGEAKSRS